MKFCYITRTPIPDYSAQSIQIREMATAFNNLIGDDFLLLSSTKKNTGQVKQTKYNWEFRKNVVDRRSQWNQINFLILALPKIISSRVTVVFTRDIIIAFLATLFGKKVVYETHKELKNLTSEFLFNRIKDNNEFYLITITDSLRKFYKEEYSMNEERILNIHNGVNHENYTKLKRLNKNVLRQELGLPQEKIIIVHTGSLYKGRDAELFKEILKEDNNQIFIHIGGTPTEQRKWKEYYKNFENIMFLEHIFEKEKIRKYQVSADLLFYSLTYENEIYWCTSPLKLFEYMASGVPILGSNIGAVNEILHNENSILFDPLSPSSIQDGFSFFLTNRDEAKYRAMNALEETKKYYDWNKRAESILSFINYV